MNYIGAMNSYILLLAILLAPGSVPAADPLQQKRAPNGAEGTIISAVDIPAWVDSRFASVKAPGFRTGSLDNLFDRDAATAAACASEGLMTLEIFFRKPIDVYQVGVTPCRGAAYRWDAACASSPEADGRFVYQPLVERRNVRGGARDPVRFARGKSVQALRITAERMTNGSHVILSEIEIYAGLSIESIEVEWPGAPFVAGGVYQLRVEGRDSRGGRMPLDEGVRWALFPEKNILSVSKTGTTRALAPGKVEVRVSFGELRLEPRTISVTAPAPAPGTLTVTPAVTTATVCADFAVPPGRILVVYRREEGAAGPAAAVHRSPAAAFNDSGLKPGAYHYYCASLVDSAGNPVTQRTPEIRIRTLDAGSPDEAKPSWTHCACLEVLVVRYAPAGAGEGSLEVGALEVGALDEETIAQGLELARTFFFRNSLGRLNVDFRMIRLDAPLPRGAGPLIYAVENDLAKRGLLGDGIRLIHVIGPGLNLNCGGVRFANGAAVSFGGTATAAAPLRAAPGVLDVCWTIVHELQHSLQAVVDGSRPEPSMLSGHFLDNYPLPDGVVFDAGGLYDGQAALLRRYDGWDDLPAPWNGRLEAVDKDGDGLPDDDARWPADEKRFGSSDTAADTDGDGLGDLAEYCAGIYAGTDPAAPDTDGDGAADGSDSFPLSAFTGLIPHGAPAEGALPGRLLSRGVSFRSSEAAPADVKVLASWDAGGVYIGFDANGPFQVTIHLDGSGHLGPFHSDVRVAGSAGAPPRGDVYTGVSALRAVFGEPALYKGREPLEGGLVTSWRSADRWRMVARVPAAAGGGWPECFLAEGARPAEGLVLEPGRVLGVNFTVKPIGPKEAESEPAAAGEEREFDGEWTAVFELHRFYDAVLEAPGR